MNPHLADDVVSALIDEQLAPDELQAVQLHLAGCTDCQAQVGRMRGVVSLLRQLPEVAPPRSFALGPRLVADPPNVIRLRRWYTATRVAAGSLAAGFVLLSASTLYVDSRPAKTAEVLSAAPAVLQSRDASNPVGPPAPAPTAGPASARAAVPGPSNAAAGAAAQAPAPALAARPAQKPGAGDASDQIAAATSVQPLPTQPPTPTPTAVVAATAAPVAARAQPLSQPQDDAAPFRFGAVAFGLLAALALLGTFLVRHRLQQAVSRS